MESHRGTPIREKLTRLAESIDEISPLDPGRKSLHDGRAALSRSLTGWTRAFERSGVRGYVQAKAFESSRVPGQGRSTVRLFGSSGNQS
jgi:hypothetical protein